MVRYRRFQVGESVTSTTWQWWLRPRAAPKTGTERCSTGHGKLLSGRRVRGLHHLAVVATYLLLVELSEFGFPVGQVIFRSFRLR